MSLRTSALRIVCIALLLFCCISVSSVTAAQEGIVHFPLSGITVSPGDPDLISDGMDDENPIIRVTSFDFSQASFVSLFLDIFNIHDPPVWAAELIAFFSMLCASGMFFVEYTRKKLSDDPTSRPMQVLAFIAEHPGCRQSDIIHATGFSRGSVSYNLKLLRRKGKLKRKEIKTSEPATPETYYSAGAEEIEKDPGLELLSRENPRKIFVVIAENPGISQKQIGKSTGFPTTTLRWHLSRLEMHQVILMAKDRNLTQYTVSPKYLELYTSLFSDYHDPDITKN